MALHSISAFSEAFKPQVQCHLILKNFYFEGNAIKKFLDILNHDFVTVTDVLSLGY